MSPSGHDGDPANGDLVAPPPACDVPNDVADAIRTLIRWAGDDPAREGLLDTPRRVARAWRDTSNDESTQQPRWPTLWEPHVAGRNRGHAQVHDRNVTDHVPGSISASRHANPDSHPNPNADPHSNADTDADADSHSDWIDAVLRHADRAAGHDRVRELRRRR